MRTERENLESSVPRKFSRTLCSVSQPEMIDENSLFGKPVQLKLSNNPLDTMSWEKHYRSRDGADLEEGHSIRTLTCSWSRDKFFCLPDSQGVGVPDCSTSATAGLCLQSDSSVPCIGLCEEFLICLCTTSDLRLVRMPALFLRDSLGISEKEVRANGLVALLLGSPTFSQLFSCI